MKRLLSFSVLCCAMAIAPFANAQTTAVVPNQLTNTEGPSGGEGTALGRFSNTAFIVYGEDLITAAGINPGDLLTGLAFRVDGGTSTTNDQSPNFGVDDYVIQLGESIVAPGDLIENDFQSNAVGGALTQVRSGPLDFFQNDFDSDTNNTSGSSGTPNAFGPEITFDTNYVYTGGDLLLLYSHTASRSIVGNNDGFVTAAADNFTNTFTATGDPDFAANTQIIFGGGFTANSRGFGAANTGDGGGTVVQFSVTAIPEPTSAALLMGLGLIGVARRRRTM